MKAVLPYYKKRGETPKEALGRLREERPELENEPLSYAGRLDPLAEGLLLVLVGDANKEREQYLSLPKKYLLEVLFGWSTDTYDVAGKLVEVSDSSVSLLPLMHEVTKIPGIYTKPYPPFSSKPVDGKPLFEWAREDRLNEITIPVHEIEIKRADIIKTGKIAGTDLDSYVHRSIGLLTGDFRQKELLTCWEENLRGTYCKEYDTVTLEIHCGSGTYMRQIAHELGAHLGVPALALSISRVALGDYTLLDIEEKGK